MRTFPNPYLRCNVCRQWVEGWIPKQGFVPCGHQTGSSSACPTWSARTGCQCPSPTAHDHPAAASTEPAEERAHPYDPSKSCCTGGLTEGDTI